MMEVVLSKIGQCQGCSQGWRSSDARQCRLVVQESSDAWKLIRQEGKSGNSKTR